MSTGLDAGTELAAVRTEASESLARPPEQVPSEPLDKRALWSLLAQHLSSTWSARCFDLFLVHLFPDTTLQPSIFGFCTTGAAILFSGSVGSLVDTLPRLLFVRSTIVVQRVTLGLSYALFLVCFLELDGEGSNRKSQALTGLFVLQCALSMLLNLTNIGNTVAVERDWVTAIAQGDGNKLTTLNTWLRRIDLLSKLLAPLFVSVLTSTISYTFAAAFLLGFAGASMIFEFIWINIVYKRWTILHPDSAPVPAGGDDAETPSRPPTPPRPRSRLSGIYHRLRTRLSEEGHDWVAFVTSPIFFSSLSISLLYLTVLSFDGAMIAYLKSHTYADSFVAGMRGVGVVTGLLGTVAMPLLEKHIGLVRAGSWSIISEVLTLIPALLAFFVDAPAVGKRGSPDNDAMLFTGMALSRIGLWSFDLAQLKELQLALDHHPRKNSMMSLQFSLQNMVDLLKYVVTIVLSRPSQFKWAALISFIAVCAGAVSYLVYVRRERGHLFHLSGLTEALLKKAK